MDGTFRDHTVKPATNKLLRCVDDCSGQRTSIQDDINDFVLGNLLDGFTRRVDRSMRSGEERRLREVWIEKNDTESVTNAK